MVQRLGVLPLGAIHFANTVEDRPFAGTVADFLSNVQGRLVVVQRCGVLPLFVVHQAYVKEQCSHCSPATRLLADDFQGFRISCQRFFVAPGLEKSHGALIFRISALRRSNDGACVSQGVWLGEVYIMPGMETVCKTVIKLYRVYAGFNAEDC